MKKLLIFSLTALFLIGLVSAQFPSPQDKYINDFAGILDQEQQASLQELYYAVEQETTAEITLVTLASINGSDISQYATELASEWQIGKADKDNGLLILYVQDINKIWVATGYGLEGILPDSKLGRFLDESYVPQRDQGQVALGIMEFSILISQELADNKEEIISGQKPASDLKYRLLYWLIAFIIFIIISAILSKIANRGQKSKDRGSGIGWLLLPLFLPSGRSSGFSSGGFGGGGFGGGGFGGGGAGR